MNPPPSVPPSIRARRVLLWAGGGLLALLVLALVAVAIAFASLDSGWVRRRVQAAAHDGAGIDLTYAHLSASPFSGLLLRDLAVLSAPEDAAAAPALVRVGEVRVAWSLGALLGKTVREVAVRDVAVTIVDDGSGKTSLDRWNARRLSIVGQPPPLGPVSRLLDGVVDGPRFAVEKIEVSGVSATILRTGARPLQVGTLALAGRAAAGGGSLDAAVDAGPLALEVAQGEKALGLRPSLHFAARGRELSLSLEVPVERHDLAPSLPSGSLLALRATASLQPAQGKTVVKLEQLSLVDGLAAASADLDLPDSGAPVLRAASARADLGALAAKLRDLLPATIGKGALALEVAPAEGRETRFPGVPLIVAAGRELRLSLDVSGAQAERLRLREAHLTARAADGKATVAARMAGLDAAGARVDEARLDASVVPQADGRLAVRAAVPVGRAVMGRNEARRIALGVDGAVAGAKFDGDVSLAIAEVRSGALRAADLKLKLVVAGGGEAGLALDGTLRSAAQADLRASGISLSAKTKLSGRKLDRTSAEVAVGRVAAARLRPTPARLRLALEPLDLDAQDATAQLDADAGPLALQAKVQKRGEAIEFEAQAQAERLGPFAPLAPQIQRAGFMLASKGAVRLAPLTIDETTRLSLRDVAAGDFSARAIELALSSRGTRRRHAVDLAVSLDEPRLKGRGGAGVQTVSLKGGWDFARPAAELHVKGSGVLGLDGALDATAEYQPGRVAWRLDGKFTHLGLLAVAAPPGADFDKLGLEAHGQGTLTSLVRRYVPGDVPVLELEPDPLAAIRGGNSLDLTVTGLDYRRAGDLAVRLDRLAAHVRTQTEEERVYGEASVELPSLRAQVADHTFDAADVRASLVIDTEGDQDAGAATLLAALRAASIKQDAAPAYPIADLDLRLTALADTKGALRIEEAHFENPAGGTRLDLHGGVDSRPLVAGFNLREAKQALARVRDWIPGRRNLLIEGQLAQKLDGVALPGLDSGRGTVTVPFRVESGNLSYVRATAGLRFDDVDLKTPAASVEGLSGFVPVTQDFLLDEKGGVTPVFGATSSPWSRLRFADQQPFTSGSPYVTARRVASAATGAIGPLAGNVRVDRNLVAIDQLEAELPRGGKVTGQVLIDAEGDDTQVAFRGAVTGLVTEGGDERLDANAAVTLRPFRRLLDGRIELVRLGRSHLRKLLDLYDPYQADVAANRMRMALKLGYPKRVRLGFANGFASLALELGGLAGAVRIDEMRGTPVGPVLERYLRKEEKP